MFAPRTMITFATNNINFIYRVGGIAIYNNHVLFEQSLDGTFWNLPGGRAELGETAEEVLLREMHEELGVPINIKRLVCIVENFFGAEDVRFHELNLFFLMSFPEDCYLHSGEQQFIRQEGEKQLTFAWLPIEQLQEQLIYPLCLQTTLKNLPEHPVHIVEIK